MTGREETHIGAFELERYAAGELSETERDGVDRHLTGCARCRDGLDALKADIAGFRSEVPYASFRIEHERRKEARAPARRRSRWWLPLSTFSVAAAAAVLLVVALPDTSTDTADTRDTRIKGAAVHLSFDVVTSNFPRVGTTGETLATGTTVQLEYEAPDYTHVALLGIDGAGTVSLFHPEDSRTMAAIDPDGRFPFSLTLDAANGVERMFAIFANRPAAVDPLLEAARRVADQPLEQLTRLPIDPGFAQASVWWRKPQ